MQGPSALCPTARPHHPPPRYYELRLNVALQAVCSHLPHPHPTFHSNLGSYLLVLISALCSGALFPLPLPAPAWSSGPLRDQLRTGYRLGSEMCVHEEESTLRMEASGLSCLCGL